MNPLMLIRDLKKLINEPHNPDQSLIHAQHDPDLWLFHERRMLIHDLEITTLHLFAVGHRRQEVVQDGDEEVHDEDDHGQQVDHQNRPAGFPPYVTSLSRLNLPSIASTLKRPLPNILLNKRGSQQWQILRRAEPAPPPPPWRRTDAVTHGHVS